LHVDDRAFAGHHDRFTELADLQLGSDRCGEGTSQLDTFALECVEPRQCERDGIGPRPEIFDAELDMVIGAIRGATR